MRRGSSGLNLLLGVDKPPAMSSHDVVDHVRRALGERRVGHAGTLDPAATGVLVVGVGQATRLMGLLTSETKSYVARIAFGAETNTDDAEGEVTRTAAVPKELECEDVARRSLAALVGSSLQVPPSFSAISVGGQRAYRLARSGEDVELAARPIEVYAADLLLVEAGEGEVCWQCAFTVSKGTYVRALARDLGRSLGSAAHLSELCRSASGTVTLGMCTSLDRLAELGPQRASEVALDPSKALGLPVRALTKAELERARNGRVLPLASTVLGEAGRVALVRDHRLYGVWSGEGKWLRPMANFPQGIEGVA